MSVAVHVEDLSKVYRVDHDGDAVGQRELREMLADWFRAPLHRLRHGAAHGLYTEDFWALRDVSFSLNEGEVLGIVGRNGAGKSTLLKVLSRITHPTSGRVAIHGRVGSLLEVGTGFHEDLSGRENVFLNGAILGMTRREIRSKLDDIVDFAGVARFIDTPVKRYSSGMRVRLGFAVAAFVQPEILIVDEVLAVGDVEFQRRCLGKMSSVAESGRTVLFVSHNLTAIQQLTKRCLLLEAGTLIADGPTDSTIERYLQLYAPPESGQITEAMHKVCKGVCLQRIQLREHNGKPTLSPLNFSPLQLITDFEVERQLSGMIFTIGIDTLEGMSIARFSTADKFFGNGVIEPGSYRVGINVTLPINSGTYTTFIRIDESHRPGTQLAEVSAAMNFDLLESRDPALTAARKPYQQALIPLEGEWHKIEVAAR